MSTQRGPGRIDGQVFLGELGRESIARLLEKKLGLFKRSFDDFLSVIPAHTVMTGAMSVELSTMILRGRRDAPTLCHEKGRF